MLPRQAQPRGTGCFTRRDALRGALAGAASMAATGVLAACGGAAATTTSASQESSAASAVAATVAQSSATAATTSVSAAATSPARGAVTIRFHGRIGVQGDSFTAMAQDFTKEHPNIQVKGEYFPGAQYNEKIQVLVAGGTLGDALWTASIQAFGPFAAKGILVDHTPLIATAKFNLQDLWPQAVQGVTIDGKIRGLPWIVHPGRVGLYYNKAMFDKVGQAYPNENWTYEQLHTVAKALTRVVNGKHESYGFLSDGEPWSVIVMIRSFGADYLSPDGKKVGITAPDAVAAIQSEADFYGKEKTAPTPTEIQGGSAQMFAADKLAMFQAGYWGISMNEQYAMSTPWSVAPMPKGKAGMKGMFEFDPVSVTKYSKAPQDAFSYIAYLTSKKAGLDIAQRGSVPGARQDVWSAPELMKDPNHVVFAKIIETTPPLLMPANFRALEFADAMAKGMDPLFIGSETNAQTVVIDQAPLLQAILDKPVA